MDLINISRAPFYRLVKDGEIKIAREPGAPRRSDLSVKACMDAGVVKGEGFAVDASVMEADASRYHGQAPGEIDWSAPERQTRAVAEFLSGLDDEDPHQDRKPPKVISPTDPCSAWTAKANKRVQFGYGLNYMIDVEHAVIVDVEATPARTYDEVAATRTMLDRSETTFDLKPERLTADTAYGTGKLLAWLLDKGITAAYSRKVAIDLANSPSFEDRAVLEFFETSGRNLLPAEAAAGVRHHVALSTVGTDRSDNGYFRAKVAQEKLIETSGIPYTIIRSTQFLEFLGAIAASSADGNIIRLSPARV
jgi:Transposase DDE domain